MKNRVELFSIFQGLCAEICNQFAIYIKKSIQMIMHPIVIQHLAHLLCPSSGILYLSSCAYTSQQSKEPDIETVCTSLIHLMLYMLQMFILGVRGIPLVEGLRAVSSI